MVFKVIMDSVESIGLGYWGFCCIIYEFGILDFWVFICFIF